MKDLYPIELSVDFECANAENISRIDSSSFQLSTRPDRAVDNSYYGMADYYYAFRLINRNPDQVEARIRIKESNLIPEGRTLAIRDINNHEKPRVTDWKPLPRSLVRIFIEENITECSVTIQPKSALDVSSMYWMSASEVIAKLREMETRYPDIHISSLGKTEGGRDIPIVDFSPMAEPNSLVCCIGATPQSHEMGTIAIMAVIDELLNGKMCELSEHYRFIFLPLTNPDGNALGTCMTNSKKQNVFFGYDRIGSSNAAIECELIYNYIDGIKPAFYLEFHSYPHLDRPSFRPYDFDLALFPDEVSKAKGKVFFDAVRNVSPNQPFYISANTDQEKSFRASLISRLIREGGIPATLYKLHNRETIEANCKHAYTVVERVASAMMNTNEESK